MSTIKVQLPTDGRLKYRNHSDDPSLVVTHFQQGICLVYLFSVKLHVSLIHLFDSVVSRALSKRSLSLSPIKVVDIS